MLDEWDEDVFRIVFLECDMGVAQVLFYSGLVLIGMTGCVLAGVWVGVVFYLFPISMHMWEPRIKYIVLVKL